MNIPGLLLKGALDGSFDGRALHAVGYIAHFRVWDDDYLERHLFLSLLIRVHNRDIARINTSTAVCSCCQSSDASRQCLGQHIYLWRNQSYAIEPARY